MEKIVKLTESDLNRIVRRVIKENDSIFNYFIQLRQSGIRVKKAHYFPTLVAIVQTPIYAKEKRHITPRECARLQSFPDSFIIPENDHTAYKQFGNSVCVAVIRAIEDGHVVVDGADRDREGSSGCRGKER
jgi:site-specific DNA-cytosine methylase